MYQVMTGSAGTPAVIFLAPGQGRTYALGSLTAVFKADEAETAERYSDLRMVAGSECEGARRPFP